ncbi:MAG: TetR/AcrR family transcriptional regulator [Vallitaleaceae bacterium]|nr:TetR/AcrR family transcriptional regulator [Vallitaleaceae bacterium]
MPKTIEDLRKSILVEANKVVTEQGLDQLNMRVIAKACGVAVGTLYNYFPTKEALLSELMYNYWLEFLERVQKISREEKTFYDKLKDIYEQLENMTTTFHETWIKMSKKKGNMSEKDYAQKRDIVVYLIQIIEDLLLIHQMKNGHSFDPPMTPREFSSFIVQNFLSMGQMKQFKYETFDFIIRKIV